jgi:hypothetical protein
MPMMMTQLVKQPDVHELVLKLLVLKLCGISNDEFFQSSKQNVLRQWHLQ